LLGDVQQAFGSFQLIRLRIFAKKLDTGLLDRFHQLNPHLHLLIILGSGVSLHMEDGEKKTRRRRTIYVMAATVLLRGKKRGGAAIRRRCR